MKRVFIGIRPTPETLDQLVHLQEALTPEILGPKARPVPAPSLHLTLHFIGETPPSRVEELRRALFREWATLSRTGVFTQTLDEWALLPKPDKPRVLALAAKGPCPELAQWVAEVGKRLEALGFRTEKRKNFLPHVTLARLSKAPSGPLPEVTSLNFHVANVVLFESVPGESPTYLPIQEFRLAHP